MGIPLTFRYDHKELPDLLENMAHFGHRVVVLFAVESWSEPAADHRHGTSQDERETDSTRWTMDVGA